ncbi:MAG: peptidylprolyl isomerase [Clostridia bacterium]|nr:peptidylprolyl isomerase [Clostridia bacterium]
MKHLKKILCLILALCTCVGIFASCSDEDDRCVYYDTRNTDGRNISYAKITVKDFGDIVVLLDATTAPVTVANFKKLVSEGFYNGLTFHRIMKDFMIQGGDPKGNGSGGSEVEIKGEFSENGHKNDISHLRGVISMARSDDMDSASSQFFICNADSTFLDGKYAAFGYVVKGLSVVDEITEECVKYTENEVIKIKGLQPVIESIVLLDSFEP